MGFLGTMVTVRSTTWRKRSASRTERVTAASRRRRRADQSHGGRRGTVQVVRAGSGFLSSDSPWLTLGLGQHEGPVDIEVKWPSGLVETFKSQQIKQIVTLTEGTGTAK